MELLLLVVVFCRAGTRNRPAASLSTRRRDFRITVVSSLPFPLLLSSSSPFVPTFIPAFLRSFEIRDLAIEPRSVCVCVCVKESAIIALYYSVMHMRISFVRATCATFIRSDELHSID